MIKAYCDLCGRNLSQHDRVDVHFDLFGLANFSPWMYEKFNFCGVCAQKIYDGIAGNAIRPVDETTYEENQDGKEN